MSLLCRRVIAAFAIIVGVSCSSDGGGPGPGPMVSSVAVNAGNNQIGPAGAALGTALSVVARDASNNPVAGIAVNWSAASGGGSVAPTSGTTDAAGIATTIRTLGPNAGTQTTTATISGLTPVTFSAIAQIQGATQMAVSAGDAQTDTVLSTLVTPLAVLVRDQNSAAVPGVVVNWAAVGGGSVAAATSTTNASGIATISRTFGAVSGAQNATATVTGLAGSPVTFTLTATAGNATTLVKTSGDAGAAAPNANVNYTVTARDGHGNGKSGVTIDWAVGAGGGSIAPPSNTTVANGTATALRTLGAGAGDQTATATAAGLTGSPATFTTTAALVVNVNNNSFSPTSVTVQTGGTVVWQWGAASNSHTINWDTPGAPANEPDRTTGTVSRVFAVAPGTYQYHCNNHVGMTGQVVVTP